MNPVVAEILRRYDLIRYRNERLLAGRTEEIYGKIPLIRDIDSEIMKTRSQMFRSPAATQSGFQRIEELSAKKKGILKENGYAEDYLEPIYECAFCRDTGTDLSTKERCACFQKQLQQERFKALEAEKHVYTFETFDISVFPNDATANGLTQRQRMKSIKNRCEKYADNYPGVEKHNIFFLGQAGLGKTYLLSCIAKRLADRGYASIFISAYRLFEKFLQYHLSEIDSLDDYYDIPVLIIDDLGTEPLVKNVTSEHFFTIINERMKKNLYTLIASNLSQTDLIERYGERIISRLLSKNDTELYAFEGKDIRLFGLK